MPALKVYGLGNNGFVSREIADALGMTGSHRQASVLIVAASKRAAIELAEATKGIYAPTMSDPEFRVASGIDVDALAEAGMLAEPQILATESFARAGSPAVRLTADGFHVVGEFAGDGYRDKHFIPKES